MSLALDGDFRGAGFEVLRCLTVIAGILLAMKIQRGLVFNWAQGFRKRGSGSHRRSSILCFQHSLSDIPRRELQSPVLGQNDSSQDLAQKGPRMWSAEAPDSVQTSQRGTEALSVMARIREV